MTLENLVRIHELKKEAADKREFDGLREKQCKYLYHRISQIVFTG